MARISRNLNNAAGASARISTAAILESISDGVFTVDDQWRITSFNRAAEQITGILRGEALGRCCADVFRASMCEKECALKFTIESQTPLINKSAFIIDASGRRIPISVSTAILRDEQGNIVGGAETFRDLSVIETLRQELQGRDSLGEMASRSPLMHRLFGVIPQVAASDVTVLIQGETGTGKEMLARAIHAQSPRKNAPFVAVNCGALPDTLLESELFGYKSGAFTGASRDKPGRFALAANGTIFLDEIGEITPALQIRLLRVLQERAYEPLGSTRSEKTNARVIAATNRELDQLVKQGTFRQDLFYRIQVMKLELPPLRQRKEDVPLLIEQIIGQHNAALGKNISGVNQSVMHCLMAHDFPGNIRELHNIIEHAFVLCPDGEIETHHLPVELLRGTKIPMTAPTLMTSAVSAIEAQTLLAALERNGNSRLAAARELGIHKSTFFRLAKRLGVALPKVK